MQTKQDAANPSARSPERSNTGSRARITSEINVRVGVGSPESEAGSVRSRTTLRSEGAVETRRRRSVTTVSNAEPETRTIVRQRVSKKKLVIRKKKDRYALRGSQPEAGGGATSGGSAASVSAAV